MSADPNSTSASSTMPCIMAGLVERKRLLAEAGVSERTILRWERAGMPCIRVGMLRLYDPVKVREWLLSHEYRDVAPICQCNRKKVA